ncbi:uncharacterized protein LOC134248677 [Saccostrea cucullata]|uniref:uncharacterized protein LOC134248677 n=1 Tax=Saccostrea cuccullata TaxID=36930 RepID=UPI002ED165A7
MESFIIILILYRLASLCNAADLCDASRRTVVSVNKCPENEIEWMEAAKRKNCTSLAESCSEPERIVYHCVLNPFVNETLEVCVIGRNILLGRCTEYSISGNLIQESGMNCRTFPNPCPVIYHSTEAYKYQDCYKLVPRPITSQPTTKLQVHSTTVNNKLTVSSIMPENFTISEFIPERSDNKDTTAWATVIIALIILLIVAALIYIWNRRHKPRERDTSKAS